MESPVFLRLGTPIISLVSLLLLLWWMVRFAVFLPRRTRGWQDRLPFPNRKDVEARWKVRLPDSLDRLFDRAWIQNRDFYLAPPGVAPSHWLWIDRFIPLTVRDVSAWLILTSVPGIPIAMDGRDRAYFLPFDDLRRGGPVPVWLHLDRRNYKVVAADIDQFMSLEPRTMADYNAQTTS